MCIRDSLYGNNSIVTLSDIGVNSSSLLCLTDNAECCTSSDTPHRVREWFFPNNESVFGVEDDGGNMYRDRGPRVVRLHRRKNVTMPTGVFRCEIPDVLNNSRSIYVGVYPDQQGVGTY